MEEYEREALDALLKNLQARMAQGMENSLAKDELIQDREQLAPIGRAWVKGYLTAQLSIIRGSTTGNANLTDDDSTEIDSIVDRHQSQIAAELYA